MKDKDLISQLTEHLKKHDVLNQRFHEFLPKTESFLKQAKWTGKIDFQRLVIQGEIQRDYRFSPGLNDLRNEPDLQELELFYLIKLCLSGKNDLSPPLKKRLRKIYLQFSVNGVIHTNSVTFDRRISAVLYSASIDEILNQQNPDTKVILEARHLKEFQETFKAYFSDQLNLPFLNNATFNDNKYAIHSITFATYYNLFFLDPKKPLKIFAEEQSSYWRKRVFQIILGLRGIPLISFFQTLLAENSYHETKIRKLQNYLGNKIRQTSAQAPAWQKKLRRLLDRKKELQTIKESLSSSYEEQYYFGLEKKMAVEMNELQHQIHQYQTKELLILQDIQHHGGDFQPKKPGKKNLQEEQQEQFALFKKNDNLSPQNQEKIESLMGDYYLNRSHIELLESNLAELISKKEQEQKKAEDKGKSKGQDIDKDLDLLDLEIKRFLSEHPDWQNLLSDKYPEPCDQSLLTRDIQDECRALEDCVTLLKEVYEQPHKTQLRQFFYRLKHYLNLFGISDIQAISVNKYYIPKLLFSEAKEMSFYHLSAHDQEIFMIGFYLTLLQIGMEGDGLIPSVMLIYLPDGLRKWTDVFFEKIQALFKEEKLAFQLLFM